MKRFATIVLLTFVVSLAAFTQEDTLMEASGSWEGISISSGLAIPSLPMPFREERAWGLNVTGSYGYSFPPGELGYGTLYGQIEYNQFPLSKDGVVWSNGLRGKNVDISGDPATVLTATVNFKGTFTSMGSRVHPYFLIGIGYFTLDAQEVAVTGDSVFTSSGEDISAFSWRVGGGMNVRYNDNISFFVEGRYSIAVIEEPLGWHYAPINIGFRYRP